MRGTTMGRVAGAILLAAGVGLLAPRASGEGLYEIDYANYDVRVTDSKGVVTEAQDFGFNTGPNVLMARRGDGYVEIPFRKIRTLEVGEYVPSRGHSPCTVTSRRGQSFRVELERVEGQRFLSGTTELGAFRIRLGQIRRLDLLALSRTEDMD